MSRRRMLALGFTFWLGLLAAPLHAEVVYDTYPLGPAIGAQRLVGTGGVGDFQYADPFVLSGGDARLETVTVRLRTTVDVNGGTLVVRFREDSGGSPGAVLESWVVPEGLEPAADVALASQLDPLLLDGETYWINVAAEEGFGSWSLTDDDSIDYLFADTGNVDPDWQMPPPDTSLVGLGLARVEVPEPAPTALAAVAVLGFPILLALRGRLTR